jgi:Co/Zn/Cd efflux system component
MSDCCQIKSKEQVLKQKKVLWVVLILNAVMFVVEAGAGLLASSSALLADSLDMLGDALVYGLSIWALQKTALWQGRVSKVKGVIMSLLALGVIFDSFLKIFLPHEPSGIIMLSIGVLALMVNSLCFYLIYQHREDGVNLRSAWICSRNDLLVNAAVLIGGALVILTSSYWPDIILGIFIGGYVLKSSLEVLTDAQREVVKHKKCD